MADPNIAAPTAALRTRRRRVGGTLETFLHTPSALIGAVIVALVILMGLVGPLLVPFSPTVPVPGGLSNAFAPPSSQHWLGIDGQGRDVLSRIVAGAAVTLTVGVSAVLVGATIGTVVGGIAGYVGRAADAALMRVIDILLAFPALLLALGIVAAFGQGRLQVVLAVGITTVPVFARLVRSEVQRQMNLDYVSAARLYGASAPRILLRHLVPNAAHLIIVQVTLLISAAIIEVAALGYLGLGPADPRDAEWGSMITEATQTMRSEPLLLLWPSLALVVCAVGFNLLGDGLRHALEEN